MQLKKSAKILAFILCFTPFLSIGSPDDNAGEEKSLKEKIKEDIQHHVKDSYGFHILTDEESGVHYTLPLPIILIEDGFHVFMSSDFHHGEEIVESDGKFFALYHGKIYNTNAAGDINYDEDGVVTNSKPLDFSITKTVLSIFLTSLLVFWLFRKTARVYNKGLVPKGIAKFMEPLILFVKDEIAIPNIGEKHHGKYMGYLLTVFFFIWIANLLGLTPLGINVTGNIAITFALAILTFLITQFTANKSYWKHIFWMPGVPVPMKFILAPIELLGVFIKPFALMIRLFANISAGHIVLMSLIGLLFIFQNWFARGAFFGLTVFLGIIELLVAFLQAYIFTMLTALYFGMAVQDHHDDH